MEEFVGSVSHDLKAPLVGLGGLLGLLKWRPAPSAGTGRYSTSRS